MGKRPRIDISGYWYHVAARGQRREDLFIKKADYHRYLEELELSLKRCEGKLGAFCLMSNHVHLLICLGDRPLGHIIQIAHSRYGRYFNKEYRKSGHVFQGRYKAKLILDDSYMTMAVSYIHQNPVRSGIVQRVQDYPWTSDMFYRYRKQPGKIGMYSVPGGMNPQRYKNLVDGREEMKLPEFQDFIGEEGMEEGIDRRKGGRGSGKYRERRGEKEIAERIIKMAEETGQSLETLRSQTRRRKIAEIRHRIMVRLYRENYPPAEIARQFNRTPASVFRALERYDK